MFDGEFKTAAEIAARRAAHAQLLRDAQSSISGACDRLDSIMQGQCGLVSPTRPRKVDPVEKMNRALAAMRERAGVNDGK